MSELEEKLSKLLSDPNMMQQIAGLARNLSGTVPPQEPAQPQAVPASPPPQLDPRLSQLLTATASARGTDANQEALLKALKPYLSQDRIQKLERAMGAARMAVAASAFLNAGGIRLLNPR